MSLCHQSPAHWNLIGRSMIAPQPVLSPSSIVSLPSSQCPLILARKNSTRLERLKLRTLNLQVGEGLYLYLKDQLQTLADFVVRRTMLSIGQTGLPRTFPFSTGRTFRY
jgi:hypothetical protein